MTPVGSDGPAPETRTAFRVRLASENDAAAVAALAAELGYPADIDAIRDRLRSLAERADHAIFVVEIDGAVGGWVHVLGTDRLVSGPFAEIGGMIVGGESRRRGLGRLLVEAAARWARERGLGSLRVRSQLHRAEAHRFYERAGFERIKEQAVFDLSL